MNKTTRSILTIQAGKLKDQLAHERKMEELQADRLRLTRLTIANLTNQVADLQETLEDE